MSLMYLDAVKMSLYFPCSNLLIGNITLNLLDNTNIDKIKSQLQLANTNCWILLKKYCLPTVKFQSVYHLLSFLRNF